MQMLYVDSYSLKVEYEDECNILDNVYPDRYCYLNLIEDVFRMFPTIKYALLVYVLGNGMQLESDQDIDTMFRK